MCSLVKCGAIAVYSGKTPFFALPQSGFAVAAFIGQVVDQASFARVVAVARFVSEVVAVPAVDVSDAVVLGVERALLLLDPRRAGAGAGRAVGFGVFGYASTQCVVGEGGGQAFVFVAGQAVVEVPGETGFFAVVEAFKQVAAGVVGVLLADVVAQQVVEELGRRVVEGPARGLGVEQVAGRVEGEGFFFVLAAGSEQAAERVVGAYTIGIGSAEPMLLGC